MSKCPNVYSVCNVYKDIWLYNVSIMNNTNMNKYVKTHTYWMTVKEYIRWSKNQPVQVHFNSKNNTTDKDRQLVTRTHIFFV